MEGLRVVVEPFLVGCHRKPSWDDETRVETHLMRSRSDSKSKVSEQ